MRGRKLARLIAALVVVSMMAAGNAFAGPEVKATLQAVGGAPGGTGHIVLIGMDKIVKKAHPSIDMTLIPGAFVGNISRVNSGDSDLASTASILCYLAEKQVEPMNISVPDVRSLFNIQDMVYFVVFARKDLPVDSIDELIEKKYPLRVCALAKGSVGELAFRTALSYKNATWDDIRKWGGKVNHVGWGDAVSLVKDGHADAIFLGAIKKQGFVMELAQARDMKFLKWGKGFLDFMNKNMGCPVHTFPGGMFKGIDYDVVCPTFTTEIIINSKVSDEVAYAIVKAMAEGAADYRSFHAALSDFTAQGMPKDIYLPMHPGAAKYYKEKGYIK